MAKKQKLELTEIGKEPRPKLEPKLEPRILINRISGVRFWGSLVTKTCTKARTGGTMRRSG